MKDMGGVRYEELLFQDFPMLDYHNAMQLFRAVVYCL